MPNRKRGMSLRTRKTAIDWKALDSGTLETQREESPKKRSRRGNVQKRPATKREPGKMKIKKEDKEKTTEREGVFGIACRESPIFRHYFNKIRQQLQKIRFHQTTLDTYDREGWRSANLEKLRPERELQKSRQTIRTAKRSIRALLQDLVEGEEAQKECRIELDEDGCVDASNITCAICKNNDSDDNNDIILCDLEGCNRGFHQQCCVPVISAQEVETAEDWFCRRCMTMMECINEVNDQLGTDFDTWQEVFPLLDKEEAEEKEQANQTKTKRGRTIKKPASHSRAAWDTHSFASDTDDENFTVQTPSAKENDGASDKSEDDQSEDDQSEEEEEEEEEGDEGAGLILNYKRARKQVDYRALAAKMFQEELEEEGGGGGGKTDGEDKDFVEGKANQLDFSASIRELI